MGGNLEGTLPAFSAARRLLGQLLESVQFSSLYRTVPQGDPDQGPFWNAVVSGLWFGTPEGLLERLLMWEAGAGRFRDPLRPKGPRVIDLDLLMVGTAVRRSSRLRLPHPGLPFRRFAMVPLVELVPDARDPITGAFWKDLLTLVPDQGVDRTEGTW